MRVPAYPSLFLQIVKTQYFGWIICHILPTVLVVIFGIKYDFRVKFHSECDMKPVIYSLLLNWKYFYLYCELFFNAGL